MSITHGSLAEQDRIDGRVAQHRLALWRAAGFLVAASVTWLVFGFVLGRAPLRQPNSVPISDHLEHLSKRIGESRTSKTVNVLLVGDSVLWRYVFSEERDPPMKFDGLGLQHHLQAQLNTSPRLAASFRVHTLALPGLSYSSIYYLADAIAAVRPDVLLLELNTRVLSEQWRRKWARPEHARYLAPSRIPATLALPLYRVGLTVDRLLWSVLLRQTGLEGTERKVQERQRHLRAVLSWLSECIEQAFGSRATLEHSEARKRTRRKLFVGSPRRLIHEGVLRFYGPLVQGPEPNDPTAAFLVPTLRRIEEAGIPVQVFVAPINHEHWQTLGLYDEKQATATLAGLREVVTGAGSDWLDTHRLLSDRHFIDGMHLSFYGKDPGSLRVARALVPLVERGLKRGRSGAP